MTSTGKYYAVVCFGTPAFKFKVARSYRTLNRAKRAAELARGTGSCTVARVMECDTLELAKTADISRTRDGELAAPRHRADHHEIGRGDRGVDQHRPRGGQPHGRDAAVGHAALGDRDVLGGERGLPRGEPAGGGSRAVEVSAVYQGLPAVRRGGG